MSTLFSVTKLGLILVLMASLTPNLFAHDKHASHRLPGLKKLTEDRQLSYHKHWLLACGTDTLLGADRCKAQTFEFGPKTDGKTSHKHGLQLTRWTNREGEQGYNLNFWPAEGEIKYSKLIKVSVDYGPWIELKHWREYERVGSRHKRVNFRLERLPIDLLAAMKAGNNIRVSYTQKSGEPQEVIFSLLGLSKTLARLVEKEANPRQSLALEERTRIENRLYGEWQSAKRKIVYDELGFEHEAAEKTKAHFQNSTGSYNDYATINYGLTDQKRLLKLLKWGKVQSADVSEAIKSFFKPGHMYPAAVVSDTFQTVLTAEYFPDRALTIVIDHHKQAELNTVVRVKDNGLAQGIDRSVQVSGL